nr:MAG TPA: hypothetical protein [Bacteriophage sp.]
MNQFIYSIFTKTNRTFTPLLIKKQAITQIYKYSIYLKINHLFNFN